MLVLSRKPGEEVRIGNNISVSVVEIRANRVKLAFTAPGEVAILRGELVVSDDAFVDGSELAGRTPS
ncbi:MAG: carbon storage regulator [Pirellulales bacterium]